MTSERFQSQLDAKRFLGSKPEFPKPQEKLEVKFDRASVLLTRLVYAEYIQKTDLRARISNALHEPLNSYEACLVNQDGF